MKHLSFWFWVWLIVCTAIILPPVMRWAPVPPAQLAPVVQVCQVCQVCRVCRVYDLEATAYSVEKYPGPAALGEPAIPGWTVAVSRDHLELLGRRVYITGLGLRRVTDLMAEDLKGGVDICLGTERDARAFGRQTVKLVPLPEE